MYQYVDGHLQDHLAVDLVNDNWLTITSSHKQEMIPTADAELLLVAKAASVKETSTEKFYFDTTLDKSNVGMNDIEACFLSKTNSLLFQPKLGNTKSLGTNAKNTNNLFLDYIDDWILPKVGKSMRFN